MVRERGLDTELLSLLMTVTAAMRKEKKEIPPSTNCNNNYKHLFALSLLRPLFNYFSPVSLWLFFSFGTIFFRDG